MKLTSHSFFLLLMANSHAHCLHSSLSAIVQHECLPLLCSDRIAENHATIGTSFWRTRKRYKQQGERPHLLGRCPGTEWSLQLTTAWERQSPLGQQPVTQERKLQVPLLWPYFRLHDTLHRPRIRTCQREALPLQLLPPGLCHAPAVDCSPACSQG